jgi:hypothetical protein
MWSVTLHAFIAVNFCSILCILGPRLWRTQHQWGVREVPRYCNYLLISQGIVNVASSPSPIRDGRKERWAARASPNDGHCFPREPLGLLQDSFSFNIHLLCMLIRVTAMLGFGSTINGYMAKLPQLWHLIGCYHWPLLWSADKHLEHIPGCPSDDRFSTAPASPKFKFRSSSVDFLGRILGLV